MDGAPVLLSQTCPVSWGSAQPLAGGDSQALLRGQARRRGQHGHWENFRKNCPALEQLPRQKLRLYFCLK